ncbi:MAG: transcription elongation factor GreA [Bacteroidetes bacterium]|nr:MAG: transcription elongation factor GreA [Bacteroidota bacterium]
MADISYITEEGLKKLKEEIEQLSKIERPAISKQIAEARDKGDLSENAEYAAAREAQSLLELRIAKLNDVLSKSRVIDQSQIDLSTVQILNKVKIKNKKTGQVMQYMLVSESEADLKAMKLSTSTPIAKGLLGKKVGDLVDIQVPSGTIPFEIIEISR